VIQVLANQHQLIFGGTFPLVVIQGKALTTEVEDMAFGAFVKPENSLRPKHRLRQLVIEEMLKLANGEGALAGKGQRRKPING
jgi:hypothetical protein